MQKYVENGKRLLGNHARLFWVALATLLMIGLLPHWVNAENAQTASFTSPLPKPTHDQQIDDLRETLSTIIDRDALTAAALGISVDDLKAARESGVRLDELITKLGLDKVTVYQAIQTAFTKAVEQAVTDGLLTQTQANIVLTPPARGGEEHHGPNQAEGDRHSGDHPNDNETPVPTSATPSASTSNNGTTDNATPVSAPEHRPHDGRGNPNAQGNQPTNSSTNSAAAATNASTNTGEHSAQTSHSEAGGSHNRPAGNRRSGH